MTTSVTSRVREGGPGGHETTRPADRAGAPTGAGRGQAPRIEGLDGLRALAIVAVLVFHLNASWLPGGFIGVDVFFVVSGFLITTLLVRERRRSGRINLSQFWARRARRLLPALVVVVTVSVLIARAVDDDLLVDIGRQVVGALTFSTNWVEIAAGSSYFDQTAPQLFMNFWSLAVEEQFYLLWPVVMLLLLRLPGRVGMGMSLALAAGSSLLMALLWAPDAATRVYYGTDTHLMGLMVGAALAFAWTSPGLARHVAPSRWGRFGGLAVPLAGVVLVCEMFLLDEADALTFRGGILLACAATAVLVMGVLDRHAHRMSTWQRVTRQPVATWVGVRSYSIYLWHWPVILIVAQDNPSAPGTIDHLLTRAWCVLVILALSDLTYRFVETPFRVHGFRGTGARVGALVLRSSRRVRQVVALTAVTLVVLTLAVVLTAPDESETARMLRANEAALTGTDVTPTSAPTLTTPGAPSTPSASATASATAPSTAPAAPKDVADEARNPAFTMPSGAEIDGYGDSMMIGSIGALKYYFPGVRLNAKSNRRWSDGLAAVKARGADNRRAVVLAFGTNFGTDEPEVNAVLDALGSGRMIVLVNVMGPFARVEKDNAALDRIAAGRPNVVVADWAAAVRANPAQVQSDRVHPTLTGAHLFAKTVRMALAQLCERHTGAKVVLKDLPIP